MLNQLIKLTALTLLWSKYKTLILSTACLFAFFWLTGLIHADFLAYSEIEGSGHYLGLSFFIKWAGWLLGIGIYLAFHYRRIERQTAAPLPKAHQNASTEVADPCQSKPDPFAKIREKDSLRSKADLIISKNKH